MCHVVILNLEQWVPTKIQDQSYGAAHTWQLPAAVRRGHGDGLGQCTRGRGWSGSCCRAVAKCRGSSATCAGGCLSQLLQTEGVRVCLGQETNWVRVCVCMCMCVYVYVQCCQYKWITQSWVLWKGASPQQQEKDMSSIARICTSVQAPFCSVFLTWLN
jgi:hypothetical protein